MKKYISSKISLASIFSALVMLFTLGLAASCAEDEGNYSYTELKEFKVDTTGVQKSFTISQFDNIQIPSHLKYEGDKSGLKYVWSIYKSGTGQNDTKTDTLATSEDLNAQIRVAPGSYYIEFCALEPATGLRAMMQYPVTVESSVGTGLIMMYEKADGTADLGILKTPLFASGIANPTMSLDIFSRANPDYNMPGKPQMFHVAKGYYIIFATDKDAVRVSGDNLSITDTFEKMFYTTPDVYNIEGSCFMNGIDVLVNNGKIHVCDCGWADGNYYFTAERHGDYTAASDAIFAYGACIFAYDQKNMRFIGGGEWSAAMDAYEYKNAASAFDFSNIGKKQLYMDYAYGKVSASNGYNDKYIAYSVMMNPEDDSSRYIYVSDICQSSYSKYLGQGIIDITACEDITKAEKYAFGGRGPVAFYSTKNAIYQINYDISSFTSTGSTKVFSTDEEITCMKLFKEDGLGLEVSANSKYLLVATYNAATKQGTLHIYSCDLASGKLSAQPLESHKVNGKITAAEFKAK